MRRLAGRLATPALSVMLVLATTAGTPAAVPTAHGSDRTVELPRPVHGATAVRLLDDQLDEAAASNDMSAAELTELLTTDPSAWVDTAGAVFFKEGVAPAPADDPVSAQAPLDQTLQLHSSPGSTKTIFLDFDGGTASATGWHASYPAMPTTQPAWDPSGNGASFTDAELTSIQTIWQAVAEDYAPFDVDVTTADPGPAGIFRTDVLDLAYGSHALISPSAGAHDAICDPLNDGSACGGVAYIGVFGSSNGGAAGDGYGFRQPAWIFPQKLGNSPKNIAEAVTHEVGHNFGLRHDGTPTQGYDRGHGAWAPIMGAGYDHPITQWSKGDYADANNQEDDVAVILGVAGARADEAPTTIGGAPAVPTGTAYVTSRLDVDTYLLGTCNGIVSVGASPLPSQANLDLRLSILDGLGQVVATMDPASAQTSTSTASGLGAALTQSLPSGTYYVAVDGVGNGPWSTGYDDYGSLGAYTVTTTGCDPAAGPTATMTGLVASATGRTVTLTATPTTTLGTLLGDVVFREGETVLGTEPLGLGSPALTLTSVAPGTHTYTATFVPLGITHLGSVSPARTVTVRTTSTTGLIASASGRDVTLGVQVATDGGTPAGTVELRDGGTLVGNPTLSAGAASVRLTSVAPGDHAFQATFVPSDPAAYAGSSSPVRAVTIAEPLTPTPTPTPTPTADPTPTPPTGPSASASTTTLRAPKKARPGTRPTIQVTVRRGAAAATGTVAVRYGTRTRTLTLTAGTATLRLPKLKAGKLRITVRYAGDATTTASTASRTIRVRT